MGEALESLSESVAVTQHHDAVTGTEKQHVAEDYHYRCFLMSGIQAKVAAEEIITVVSYLNESFSSK